MMDLNYNHISSPSLASPIDDLSERPDPIPYRILLVAGRDDISILDAFQSHDTMLFHNYSSATSYLKRILCESERLPDVIVGYCGKGTSKNLGEFIYFLNKEQKLGSIPFISMENEKGPYRNRTSQKPVIGIDGVFRKGIDAEELTAKITLLKKFKSIKQQRKLTQLQDEEIPIARKLLYKIDIFFKRLMDILISLVALAILSPVLLVIAIIIEIDSRGPVFYISYRAGSRYRIFKFFKFRTMVVEADSKITNLMSQNQYNGNSVGAPVFFKISNDPRVTSFGRFLRNTSLDELPQLFNVLKGDMSLVGNRPLPLYEAKMLTTDRHAERFNAPAGITGLWQISKRGQKDMSEEERIALDINYARHNSFVNDFQIILRTPKALMQKDNV